MVFRLFFSLHKNRSKIFGCFRYSLSGRLDCDIYLLHIYGIVSYLDCKETLGRSVRQDIWRLGLIYRKGNLTTEAIENVMLLFPFTFLLGILLRKRWKKYSPGSAFRYLALSGFFMSLTVETVQLLLKRGTFQFSDLFYNTTGGILGGAFYLTIRRLRFKICACKWQSKHKK